ncbi:type II secretion system F family protein [Pseudothermotoga thermarum]|uniref:Type II secretion system F domain protein n=1 Tax=Pseudothermotoga thermarum DSM 5069 TaxID=688269 RepID=F7YYE3_9THEM|nr:type II secretion system F family protein [Pseudothermotoga thermarum]AEH50967.1 Type II secretion system F domain protein [Pseudothermotoga thermarum DSM 5069]
MPYFRYTAVDSQGKRVKAVVEAENEIQLYDILKRKGYAVLEVKKVGTRRPMEIFGISLAELSIFSRQLATMVSAGLRIKDALTILSNQAVFSKRFRKIIERMIVAIESGSSFSSALQAQGVFDSVFVNLVAAGEEGGVLDKSLEKAADFYESTKRLQDEVKSAMAYPTFVLVFAIGVIFIISFYILPTLISAFGNIPTSGVVRFLMNVSNFLREKWTSVLTFGAIFALSTYLFMKTRYAMYLKELFATLFPPAAKLRYEMAVERFCRTLSVLTASGVLLTKAVEMAALASNNPKIIRKSKFIIERIREGTSLKQALLESGVFPQMVYELVGTGEETGKLEEVLAKVSEFYEDQVRVGVKKLVSLVEPMLIAGVGGFIAFMAFAMYSTIFQLQQTIGR